MRYRTLAAAMALAVAATPALAQDARGKRAGDFYIGASVIGVLPANDGSTSIGGTPHASDAYTPQLDFTYFLTNNIALNLIAATTRHDLEARGTAIGNVDLGHTWLLPPTLTLQYHPLPNARFSPYLGAGINYTIGYSEGGSRNPAVTSVDVEDAWGFALNFGVDYELSPNWLLNFDVKYIFLETDIAVGTTLGPVSAKAELNPWVLGVGVRYRF